MEQQDGSSAPLVQEPLAAAYRQLRGTLETLLINPSTRAFTPLREYWETMFGLLLGSAQAYAAALFLVGDERGIQGSPGPYPGPASTVARSCLEILGNMLAMREDPKRRARLFLIDDYREMRQRRKELCEAYPDHPGWREWGERSDAIQSRAAIALELSPAEITAPGSLPSWPNPSRLHKAVEPAGKPRLRAGTPYLSGTAAALYRRLIFHWYPELSRVAHYKSSGVAMALVSGTSFGSGRQLLRNPSVIAAVLFHACAVTEVCDARTWGFGPERSLRQCWAELRKWSEDAEFAFTTRYAAMIE